MSSATAASRSEHDLPGLRAGMRLQMAIVRAHPDYWISCLIGPFLAIALLAVVRDAGRDDLLAAAMLAPALITMVQMSLFIAGETIEQDRWGGTLEPALAAPASFATILLGRVTAVTLIAGIGFVESWLVTWALFGEAVPIHHPFVFAVTAVATLFAMSVTALLVASVFVLARSARIFQNSLAWPLYMLGGVMVPVSVLPFWLRPASWPVFLSWSSGLLRDALDPAPVAHVLPRLSAILLLAAVTLVAALWTLGRVIDRVRYEGTVTFS